MKGGLRYGIDYYNKIKKTYTPEISLISTMIVTTFVDCKKVVPPTHDTLVSFITSTNNYEVIIADNLISVLFLHNNS